MGVLKSRIVLTIKGAENLMKLFISILFIFFSINAFSQVVEIKKAEGVSNFQAINALSAVSGSVVISGSANLIEIKDDVFSYIECPFDELGLSSTIALAQDEDNNIWTSSENGKVGFFNGKDWTVFEDLNGSQTVISAIAFDDDNKAWAIGENKLYNYTGTEWLQNADYSTVGDVKDMFWQKDTLWLAVENQGLVKFTEDTLIVFPINDLSGQNSDLSLAIDRDGKKWVSSSDYGLACFDGSKWESYSKTEYPFLEDLSRVYIDYKGWVWACSLSKGISYFDRSSWANLMVKDGLFTNEYSSLSMNNKGVVWFCSETGVCSYTSSKISNYLSDANIAGDYFATQFFDSQDRMWISTYDGTTLIDSMNSINEVIDEIIKTTYFTVIKEDQLGNIWAGTLDGLWKFEVGAWTRFTTEEGLIHNSINDIEIDGDNSVWCATMGGVSKYNNNHWVNYSEADGLHSTSISYISIDNNTNVWVSSFGIENSLSVFNGEYWNRIETDLADSTYILAMELDLSNSLWLGTTNGLYKYKESGWSGFLMNADAGSNISSITIDPKNNLLILNEGERVISFDGETVSTIDSFESFPGKMSFDNQGYLWGRKGTSIQRGNKTAPYLRMPVRYRTLGEDEIEFTFNLISNNTKWEINSNDWWLSVNPSSGEGDTLITVWAEYSFNPEMRRTELNISGSDIYTQTLTVFQVGGAAVEVSDQNEKEDFRIINRDGEVEIVGANYSHCEIYSSNGIKLMHSNERQISLDNHKYGIYLIKIFNTNDEFDVYKTVID